MVVVKTVPKGIVADDKFPKLFKVTFIVAIGALAEFGI